MLLYKTRPIKSIDQKLQFFDVFFPSCLQAVYDHRKEDQVQLNESTFITTSFVQLHRKDDRCNTDTTIYFRIITYINLGVTLRGNCEYRVRTQQEQKENTVNLMLVHRENEDLKYGATYVAAQRQIHDDRPIHKILRVHNSRYRKGGCNTLVICWLFY